MQMNRGGGNLYSPHIDIIEGMDVVNYVEVDSETFTCEFGSDGKVENVQYPISFSIKAGGVIEGFAALSDMTWDEWIISNYNPLKLTKDSNGTAIFMFYTNTDVIYWKDNVFYCLYIGYQDDKIENKKIYNFEIFNSLSSVMISTQLDSLLEYNTFVVKQDNQTGTFNWRGFLNSAYNFDNYYWNGNKIMINSDTYISGYYENNVIIDSELIKINGITDLIVPNKKYAIAKLKKETWRFNEGFVISENYTLSIPLTFESNGANYTTFCFMSKKMKSPFETGDSYMISLQYYDDSVSISPYDYRTTKQVGEISEYAWTNDAYRTIILDEPATGDLLTFLQANATKIS